MTLPLTGPVLDRRTLLGAACAGCLAVTTGCGSDAPAAAPASTPAAGGPLVALADLPVGSSTSVKAADGTTVLVSRTGESTAVAFSARCTHQGCTVAVQGEKWQCPCHGSAFSPQDGSVLQGPAKAPLAAYPVTVSGGAVVPA